jgi:lipopolysaccharide transport system ATP-binding protein
MYVRLAFSIAAHLEPEVLLLDEVLSVGDRAFREKCLERVDELTSSGRTVLFVSHDMASVMRMCPRSIVLERGRVTFQGPTEDAAAAYAQVEDQLATHEREGSGEVRVAAISVRGADGGTAVRSGEHLSIAVELETSRPLDASDIELRIGIHTKNGMLVQLTTAVGRESPFAREVRSGTVLHCNVPSLPLRPGEYRLSLRIDRGAELIDRLERGGIVRVLPGDAWGTGVLPGEREPAPLLVPHGWRVTDVTGTDSEGAA